MRVGYINANFYMVARFGDFMIDIWFYVYTLDYSL